MAAIGSGASGGEGASQQAEGAQQGQGHEAAQAGSDLSPLVEQLSQQGQSLEEMRAFLASNPWAAQQVAEEQQGNENYDVDLSFLETETDPNAAAERLGEIVNGLVDQRTQAQVAPVMEQMTNLRRDQAARDLAAEFPELAEEKMAQMVAGPNGLAAQAANALGQPALAAEPAFWRLAYMAHKAAEAANQESESDGSGAASLESGGGAGPAQVSEADLVKAIANAGPLGKSVLDFM